MRRRHRERYGVHKAIDASRTDYAGADYANLRFNTAIAKLIE
jgi:hypothetical protein